MMRVFDVFFVCSDVVIALGDERLLAEKVSKLLV